MLSFGLTDGYERCAFHHGVALAHVNLCDCSVGLSLDVVLHLHCFEDDNGVACLNGIANGNLHVGNCSRQRSHYFGTLS